MSRTKPKNRRKQHSVKRRAQRVAPSEMKNYGVIMVSGWNVCKLIDMRTGLEVPATKDIDDALRFIRYQWVSHLAVFGAEANGKLKMSHKEIVWNNPSYQRHLVDLQQSEHQALLDDWRGKTYLGFGWLSTPYPWDISDDDLDAIFTQHGAYIPRGEAEAA